MLDLSNSFNIIKKDLIKFTSYLYSSIKEYRDRLTEDELNDPSRAVITNRENTMFEGYENLEKSLSDFGSKLDLLSVNIADIEKRLEKLETPPLIPGTGSGSLGGGGSN